jgi:hypothetical protein
MGMKLVVRPGMERNGTHLWNLAEDEGEGGLVPGGSTAYESLETPLVKAASKTAVRYMYVSGDHVRSHELLCDVT